MFVQEQRFVLGFPKQSAHDVTKVNEISTCQSQQGDKQKTKRVRELLHLSTDDIVLYCAGTHATDASPYTCTSIF